jgi:7-cyano-7-deazaguanine reductase
MELPLGKTVEYRDTFDPTLLFPIERALAREKNGVPHPPPFEGVDVWRAFELSWLNEAGVPKVAIAKISYSALSPKIVESKSLKLFLNSFNNFVFNSEQEVVTAITEHLAKILEVTVEVELLFPSSWHQDTLVAPPGESIDDLKLPPALSAESLKESDSVVRETLHSNLLRSLCPVTGQPDWGTLVLSYQGKKLNRAALLSSLIEHRNFQGFHEECCEKYFMLLDKALEPTDLTVGCFYTRRGGIDINPIRWKRRGEALFGYERLSRQ